MANRPPKTIYKNDKMPSGNYTDLAGNTMTHYYGGELRLGDDASFEGHQSLNLDDTLTAMPVEDEYISESIDCSCCGIPVKDKSKLTKVNGFYRCSQCIDEEWPQ